ncbi:related to nuclear segregation (Bfr1) [Lecanosticta acicola]|uniref:Related to nuclear segregation (Bfr1) n=1 Tax=Lecanosticta acicola TaxID=111012 RepID=A0AAI8Z3H3_9PEZI|nr:related to nuclear segregation (Bfr1) [Lecanosticta acicola]
MAAEVAKADQAKPASTKPERPNEEEFKANLAKAEKELKATEERMKQIKAKIENAQPKNKDSPNAKRQQELRNELSEIRTQQQSSKSGRTQVMDKIKRLDEQLKARIAESKNARNKVQFKSADDVQKQIDALQKDVDSGKLKIVDEKKALSEISQLNRIKKGFAGFDESQKGIDETKAQISELKKQLDDPESKALSERYTKITTELDTIKAEQDDAFKNLNALRDERSKIHEDQQKKYSTVKEIKDAYYSQRRAAMDYEREARRVREEKRRAENDAYHRGRRQEAAKAKLEDASAPAYGEQIRIAQSLLAHFDPSSVGKQEVAGPGKFAAAASRTVDASGIKGTALKKKGDDDDAYFVGSGGKKKKGGKKGQSNGTSSPAPEGKFQLDPRTIEYLAEMNIDPPLSQADVPTVVEKIKEKLEFWKKDQDRKTKENVANAEAEIKRLEEEAAAISAGTSAENARKPATEKQQVNGSANAGAELSQEKDAAADVSKDLEKVKIEDQTAPEGTA